MRFIREKGVAARRPPETTHPGLCVWCSRGPPASWEPPPRSQPHMTRGSAVVRTLVESPAWVASTTPAWSTWCRMCDRPGVGLSAPGATVL